MKIFFNLQTVQYFVLKLVRRELVLFFDSDVMLKGYSRLNKILIKVYQVVRKNTCSPSELLDEEKVTNKSLKTIKTSAVYLKFGSVVKLTASLALAVRHKTFFFTLLLMLISIHYEYVGTLSYDLTETCQFV